MKTKTIIISSYQGKTNARAILTLYEDDDLLKCRMRTYSMPKLSRHIRLAIYHDKNVYKANLIEKFGTYESSFVGEFNIDHDFYCALIDTENDNEILLTGGTYGGYYFNDNSVFTEESNLANESLDSEETLDICDPDSSICDRCKTCKYKEFFYSHNEMNNVENIANTETINDQQNIDENPNLSQPSELIQNIIPQFDYIFEHYDNDETLSNLIPNSRFVRISENNENYSIGAIYDKEDLRIICYAVLCDYKSPAPKSLGSHYQWLPIDKDDPLSDGYYIVFQDAKDLKILEL